MAAVIALDCNSYPHVVVSMAAEQSEVREMISITDIQTNIMTV